MKTFIANWVPGTYDHRTEEVSEDFFSLESGYSQEDINKINALKVGEMWNDPLGDHTVERNS